MAAQSLIDLTATEARDKIAKGDISAEAYTKACLDQIAARDPQIEAWAFLDPEHALAQARAIRTDGLRFHASIPVSAAAVIRRSAVSSKAMAVTLLPPAETVVTKLRSLRRHRSTWPSRSPAAR